MDNVRFYFLTIIVKNLLTELLRTKGSVSSKLFTLRQLIDLFVFGGIYVNNRSYTFPSFKHILFMFLKKVLVVICFRVSSKKVYSISISREFFV